jgi:hypothetical protein
MPELDPAGALAPPDVEGALALAPPAVEGAWLAVGDPAVPHAATTMATTAALKARRGQRSII